MSLFEYAKTFIESEIFSYKTFLIKHIGNHEVPPADISLLREWVCQIQSKVESDLGKKFEDAVKTVIVPNWKTIFEADNYIDTGKTIEEQRVILKSILDCLRSTGFVDNKYLPDHIVKVINRDFLTTSDFKTLILIEELTAEYNLCDPSISWIDALIERIRVMYYSGLLVGDIDGIETLIAKFHPSNVKSVINKLDSSSAELISQHIDIGEFDKLTKEFFNIGNIRDRHPLEDVITPCDITMALNILKEKHILPEHKLQLLDATRSIALICVGVAPSDDWMDLQEDTENNKITGITRGIQEGISPHDILSTTILYIRSKIEKESAFSSIELWYVELMTLMHQDLPQCLEFCKSVSPYMFESIFQRK